MPKKSVRRSRKSPKRASLTKKSAPRKVSSTKNTVRMPKSPRTCSKQTTSKYTSRPSPPYPANECCNRTMIGNDGNMYISKVDKKGICKWIKL
jgi:hypothetical protein